MDIHKRHLSYVFCWVVALLFGMTSCVKDDLNNTTHPTLGALEVTPDYSQKSSDAEIPKDFYMMVDREYPERTDSIVGDKGVYKRLLAPGKYTLATFNLPDDVTMGGSLVWVNNASGSDWIEGNPDPLFLNTQEVTIQPDDTLRTKAVMKQYGRRIKFDITAVEGEPEEVEGIELLMTGMATSVNLLTGKIGHPNTVTCRMTREGNRFTGYLRVFGFIPEEGQIIRLEITMKNGLVFAADLDVSERLQADKFNDSIEEYLFKDELYLPVDAETGGTINGWQPGNGDGEDADAH